MITKGFPYRKERLKALGNAVVPQCAYMVGLILRHWLQAEAWAGERW